MWDIQLFKLNFDDREIAAVSNVVAGGWLSMGEETKKFESGFESFLGDLRKAYKIREFVIRDTEKDNAITYDLEIRIHKDRSPKKLKIHVGRLLYTSKAA